MSCKIKSSNFIAVVICERFYGICLYDGRHAEAAKAIKYINAKNTREMRCAPHIHMGMK